MVAKPFVSVHLHSVAHANSCEQRHAQVGVFEQAVTSESAYARHEALGAPAKPAWGSRTKQKDWPTVHCSAESLDPVPPSPAALSSTLQS